MFEMTLEAVASVCGGVYVGDPARRDAMAHGITTDSRSVPRGSLFIPIVGERYDGHDFIAAAFQAGAICALSTRSLSADMPHIRVPDTLEAYQSLAGRYRNAFEIPMIGVTGSVGKTTTKELIAGVLAKRLRVHKNQGNLNNQAGVPATLLALDPEHQVAVVEMGTNHFGEIAALARMVRPTQCVLTNIGEAHLEHLGSREGILRAKCEMIDYLCPGGVIIVNGDDDMLATLPRRHANTVTYGLSPGCVLWASDLAETPLIGTHFTVHSAGESFRAYIPAPGRHMVYNALAAWACGRALGLSPGDIIEGLAGYTSISGRMHVVRAGALTLLNDAYNANPTSMAAAIDIVAGAPGRSVCILGDMLELGPGTIAYHESMGRRIAERGIGLTLCIGDLGDVIARAARESGAQALWFDGMAGLLDRLPALLYPGDTVLIKASHGMRLGAVVEYLQAYPIGR